MKKWAVVLVLLFCGMGLFAQGFFDVVKTGTPDQVEAMIKAGADIESRDALGKTPLMWAATINENPNVIKILLKVGAKIIEDKDNYGRTPLRWAACSNKNPDIITTLLNAGAKIDDRDKYGITPLMGAAGSNQNPNIITTLLNAGANATLKSYENKTALDYANGNSKLIGTPAYEKLKNATFSTSNTTLTQNSDNSWTSTPFGSYRVERMWEEGSLTNVLVSYRNTTSTTFNHLVTLTALLYDADDHMLDMNDRSFFASDKGPIVPGFEGTVKISFTLVGAKRVEIRVEGH